jgi:hypothetical protein
MEKKGLLVFVIMVLLVLTLFAAIYSVQTEDEEELNIFGLEVEKVISLVNGYLALLLFVITYLGYKRSQSKRMLYVSIAFGLFALRSFLAASELFFTESNFIDPFSVALDFIILLTFFYGMVRK